MSIGRPGLTLLASATVSRLADAAASIALVLLIIARTHDPRLAGFVVAAFTVPTLVTGPVLGAFLDRLRRRRPLFATLTVRQQAVPPDRYAQAVATAASIKTGAYALGAAVTGALVGVLTPRSWYWG